MELFKPCYIKAGANTKQGLTEGKIYEVYGANPQREQFLIVDDFNKFIFVDYANVEFAGEVNATTNNTIGDQGTNGERDTSGVETEATASTTEKPGNAESSTPKATGRFGRPVQGKGK